MANLPSIVFPLVGLTFGFVHLSAQLDQNGNGQSDIWERYYDARDLPATVDSDGDGFTNEVESLLGTDPLDRDSKLELDMQVDANGTFEICIPSPNQKVYEVQHKASLTAPNWDIIDTIVSDEPYTYEPGENDAGFYRVRVIETDTDNDGLSDWEEIQLGFDHESANTDRESTDDHTRAINGLSATSTIDLEIIRAQTHEAWPSPAVIGLRRSGGLEAISVELSYNGTAGLEDYIGPGATIELSIGQQMAYLVFSPIDDGLSESEETVTVNVQPSAEYDLGAVTSASISIEDSSAPPSSHEAGRLLAQASFGATASEIAAVQAQGIEGWIDAQIAMPANHLLQSATEAVITIDEADENVNFHSRSKLVGWWENAMHAPDQLRQRVAFALSQILVVSDDAGMIDGEPVGMANYYDIFLRNAFGNYRDILDEVTYHPVMGIYLSHKGNMAPDPSIGRFPDENYAREIMQLFTIGLWELNIDGSRRLDQYGNPISTYSNFEISELARVFTGMNWGTNDPTNLWAYSTWPWESETNPYTVPMHFWEGSSYDSDTEEWLPYGRWIDGEWVEYFIRDRESKTLIDGSIVPAGQSGAEDVAQALDVLFNHPNVGPFISRLLIQRLVKSNPSPAYIQRIASIFNDNGSGVRGDLAAVIKAILMDSEARNFNQIGLADSGKQREPYLRLVQYARTFEASSGAGPLAIFWNEDVFQQMPMSSPTVFNFYTPDYAPPGPVSGNGLVAPEFQITTTVSAMQVPNEFEWMTRYRYVSWYSEPYRPHTDLSDELALLTDPASLVRNLDGKLTYGTLSPEQHTIITNAIQRAKDRNRPDTEIAGLAVYLVMTSPDYVIQK